MLHKDLSQFEKHDNKWNPISQRPLNQKYFLVRKFWFLWSGFYLGFTESIKVLLSHLFFHQWSFSLFNQLSYGLLYHFLDSAFDEPFFFGLFFFYLGFQEMSLSYFFSKPFGHSFLIFFATLFPYLCFCPQPSFSFSFLTLYHFSQLSQFCSLTWILIL